MTKKEIVEKIKEIEKKRIAEGYLKGCVSGWAKISVRKSKKYLLEFAEVMLKEKIEV